MGGYIEVGLEYGDKDGDGKIDHKLPEKKFPILMKKLAEK